MASRDEDEISEADADAWVDFWYEAGRHRLAEIQAKIEAADHLDETQLRRTLTRMDYEYQVDVVSFPERGPAPFVTVQGMSVPLDAYLNERGKEGWDLVALASQREHDVLIAVMKPPRATT